MNSSYSKSLIAVAALFAIGVAAAEAQTLFVPSGTGGISSSTTANVGIGTNAPNAKLDVRGGTTIGTGAGEALVLRAGGDILVTDSDNTGTLNEFVDSGTAYFRIDHGGSVANGNFSLNDGRLFVVGSNGNIGIGTSNPVDRLQISNAGDVRVVLMPQSGANNRESLVDFWGTFDNYPSDVFARRVARIQAGFDGGVWGSEYMAFGVAGAGDGANPPLERMRILANGNVGIGTSNPTQKLSVNGTIRAKEVIVEASPWPDDVFAPGYNLPSVDTVAKSIETEGHLPGVPSAATVGEHGIALGEMQKTLLRKVEELTLYVVAQQKQIASQDARIRELEAAHTAGSTQ